MSSDLSEETQKIKEQLRQSIAEAEGSIKTSNEFLAKKGYSPDSQELDAMLNRSDDPKIKQKYKEYQEELQREIEQERARLQQQGAPSGGSPSYRRPMGGVKI